MDINSPLRLSIPSSGALAKPALDLLRACGLGVLRTNSRTYTAEIPALPGVAVSFQRGSDITQKIDEGSADLGIVGKDRFLESRRVDGETRVIIELGFGRSQLVLGVPDAWVDVTSIADISELSMEFRAEGSDLKIATKYPRLVERHLLASGVNYFSLVQSSGTLEVAPAMGFADIIADITESGTIWSYKGIKRSISTVSIDPGNGLLFVSDFSGYVHCLDADTGELHWIYDMKAHMWGSTLVADGKVYVGDEDGDFVVLASDKKMTLLSETYFPAPIYSTPVVANGVLYVATQSHLYALHDEARAKAGTDQKKAK